jgi:hypothetical protein
MRRILLFLVAAACASSGDAREATPPIEIADHFFEVPRIPHPGYHRDGVQVTRLDGDTAWTRGGLLVNDVVESVNGEPTMKTDEFWKATGGGTPRRVRVTGSRAGAYGYRIVSLAVS